MADVTVLHQCARELPVHQYNDLISQQFALKFHLPQHLCHRLCHRPQNYGPYRQRSLIGRYRPDIQQYLTVEPLSKISCKPAIISINQDVARTAIESSSSRLLNGRPPPLQQPNRHCQCRHEPYWHYCAPITGESFVSTLTESTRQHATIATTVVILLMTPNTYSTALCSRPL